MDTHREKFKNVLNDISNIEYDILIGDTILSTRKRSEKKVEYGICPDNRNRLEVFDAHWTSPSVKDDKWEGISEGWIY